MHGKGKNFNLNQSNFKFYHHEKSINQNQKII